ncbi:hypothetical protein EAX61_01065 [Dokdonia sinensis]|uniref:Outer membrane protein beta-barrel domain-containing protein n=1 Tax=Dokdonia sinensis TaxID=2479847 RepID=A0A3M0GMP4_9FLAO|nr:CsgG/HfaB family protein [Dokdonia sinensis]RMB64002.1 hypothetical protein EAX61_01065 [Dokdonia sinensis]
MSFYNKILSLLCLLMLSSCGAYFNQPLVQSPSRTGEFSKSTDLLKNLPLAAAKLEVAVYNFGDQTGQYKAVENGSTFSTSVTQGGTTILIKALEDSGYFLPVERENLPNLTTERQIIRNTQEEYNKNLNKNEPPLPPLLFAGVILEGGIISYDTNVVTGGLGARYFGLGAASQYRQDRITVYLRAVSTNSGEILKTVYVSKTILSQSLSANFFRFVKFQRLLEAESGITQNEPVQLAVKDAIEKAVHDLIVEGIKDGYWSTKGGADTNRQLVESYLEEKELDESTALYDRLYQEPQLGLSVQVNGGVSLPDGDYGIKEAGYSGSFGVQYALSKSFALGANAGIFQFNNKEQFQGTYAHIDFNIYADLLPNDNFAPYFYIGPGYVFNIDSTFGGGNLDTSTNENEADNENNESEITGALKAQIGAGLRYNLNKKLSLRAFVEQNVNFSDNIDNISAGKRDDWHYNFGVGLNYKIGGRIKELTPNNDVSNEN